jgi:hypothetical protein
MRGRRDRAAQIAVDKVQALRGPILCFRRERGSPLLSDEAAIANLVDVVDGRKATHHASLGQLLQRVKVQVPVPAMPLPGVLTGRRG